MSYLSVGLKAISGGVKMILKPKTAAKALKTLELPKAPKTASFYDAITGIKTNTREFEGITIHGDKHMSLVKNESRVLPDGTRISESRVWGRFPGFDYAFHGGGQTVGRTKSITCKPDNILGGKTITINKNYINTFSDKGRNETLVKMYDADGVLQHKELTIEYTNGSGYKVHATQDKVAGGNLNSSAADMQKEPTGHINCKHELSRSNYDGLNEHSSNYYNFMEKDAYSRAVETNKTAENAKIAAEQAKIAAAKEAEEAANLAAKQAAEKLKASRPRVNVGKVLGLNVDELKVVEKVQPNGGIKRYYFRPETGKGKRQPVITTYDHGSLHQEWIKNGKQDIIYMKQVGQGEPYILYKDGSYTQIKIPEDRPTLFGRIDQYVTDSEGTLNYVRDREVFRNIYGYMTPQLQSLQSKADRTYVDLEGLFRPYEV